jgi:hypothetical protein
MLDKERLTEAQRYYLCKLRSNLNVRSIQSAKSARRPKWPADASLKKQIEGSFVSDGKAIHVSSVYGTKSAPYNDLGACIDHNAQVLLARKLLSELAAGGGRQKPDQQQGGHREPMQKGEVGGGFDQGGGGQGSVGTSP